MTIPTGGLYPDAFDTDDNLFLVHDALRLSLAEDYNPGDTSIVVNGDPTVLFPPTGEITLTEQCSDIDKRAISFYYSSMTTNSFNGLELLPGFTDVPKTKIVTHVTQNVMKDHHNNIKDAVIAIEEFVGIKGTIGVAPLQGTMEQRINFLRKLVLQPKAWFTVDKTIGLVPLTVTFTDLSFRLATDDCTPNLVSWLWDFGDNTTSNVSLISIISATSVVPISATNVDVSDLDGGTITKTYLRPGDYDVTLTVTNYFGSDTLTLPKLIHARVPAPDLAVIGIVPRSGQKLIPGIPTGGPYVQPPVLRSAANTLISLEVPPGPNPATPGRSYAGEELDGSGTPIDPVVTYKWGLTDDLPHTSAPTTTASFSLGGMYDVVLRVDTKYGSYRITEYINSLDIVEKTNLWLWNYTTGQNVAAIEYGLLSESFKLRTTTTLNAHADASFLTAEPNSAQQTKEFLRNTAFTPRSLAGSGMSGTAMLYWSSGRSASAPSTVEHINVFSYNGFTDAYTQFPTIQREWNWVALTSPSQTYFVFGTQKPLLPNTSPTNQKLTALDLTSLGVSNTALTPSNYVGGASELQNNIPVYKPDGSATYGNFSVYRSAWKDSTGYIIRNDGVGPFFRLKSFYKTQGDFTNPVQSFVKLPDIPGPTKLEGQLVTLTDGVYFFNNSGAVSAYNDVSGVWVAGGPGVNSAAFRGLQDQTVQGYDDSSNTLLAASDGDRRAYLSFDYSPDAFITFNEADLTFSKLGARPIGNQWMMSVY